MGQVCKLLMVTSANNNKYYHMTENGSAIDVEYGRVDATKTRITKPISQWEKLRASKIKKGYKDVTHLSYEDDGAEDKPTEMADISDRVIDKLFKQLQDFANHTIKQNYKVSSNKVTQAMIDEAQAKVDQLAALIGKRKKFDVVEYNDLLLELFHIIPRRMGDVRDWLIKTSLTGADLRGRCEKILNKEQSTLDVMAGQVIVNSKTDDVEEATTDTKRDILTVLGLEVQCTTAQEDTTIKHHLGANKNQFKRAYKVINRETEDKFNAHMDKAKSKKIELFWHGSRNENWLNILSTGLLIRPSGAVHSGSMFGDGIYFADKAQKSIGYTSLRGSCWASGSDNTAFLALFSVHVGNQKDIKRHNSSCYTLDKNKIGKDGYDSVFAHGGADLRNNEFIVYDSNQCTVSYLVEIGS